MHKYCNRCEYDRTEYDRLGKIIDEPVCVLGFDDASVCPYGTIGYETIKMKVPACDCFCKYFDREYYGSEGYCTEGYDDPAECPYSITELVEVDHQ
jgi:hypothetical protein